VPFAQRFERVVPIEVLARAADGSDAGALAAHVREALRRVDPDVAVGFVGRADAPDFGPRMVLNYFVLIFGALAFLALAFAMSGLYGVLSHIVARRTRELGVRAALGADRSRLVRLVFRDGSRPVIEGILIGFGMAAGARLSMQPWFTEPVTAVDPAALVIALVPLLVAAALACYFPARRASRVDPNVALRHL
jgi:putative ABC transport system permease protein